MESAHLFNLFSKSYHQSGSSFDDYVGDPHCESTYRWSDHGIESAKVLSPNMLIKEIVDQKIPKEGNGVKIIKIYFCYNWKLKVEFILVDEGHQEKYSYYSPQYGRDDNYNTVTRGDYHFMTFSVDTFRRERPDLVVCLDSI